MSSTATAEKISNRNGRGYFDKYIRGSKDVAEAFIRKLQRTSEATTKFSSIFNDYLEWMHKRQDIPVSREVFINLLKTKGYKLIKNEDIGRVFYIAAKYVSEDKSNKEDKLERAVNDLDSQLNGLDFDDLTSIESFRNPTSVIEFPKLVNALTPIKEETPEHDTKKEETSSATKTGDEIKMKQMDIVDNFADIAKLELEEKLKKLDKLKEELIEKELNSVELLDAIKSILN